MYLSVQHGVTSTVYVRLRADSQAKPYGGKCAVKGTSNPKNDFFKLVPVCPV